MILKMVRYTNTIASASQFSKGKFFRYIHVTSTDSELEFTNWTYCIRFLMTEMLLEEVSKKLQLLTFIYRHIPQQT